MKVWVGLVELCIEDGDNSDVSTTNLAGTGLGISQKIAQKLGSKIQFTSAVDSGSNFWFVVDIVDGFVPNPEVSNSENSFNQMQKDIDYKEIHNKMSSKAIPKRKYCNDKKTSYQVPETNFKYDNIKSSANYDKTSNVVPEMGGFMIELLLILEESDSSKSHLLNKLKFKTNTLAPSSFVKVILEDSKNIEEIEEES